MDELESLTFYPAGMKYTETGGDVFCNLQDGADIILEYTGHEKDINAVKLMAMDGDNLCDIGYVPKIYSERVNDLMQTHSYSAERDGFKRITVTFYE